MVRNYLVRNFAYVRCVGGFEAGPGVTDLGDSDWESIERYRAISRELTDHTLLSELRALFERKYNPWELLDWIHGRVTFDKGDIKRHSRPKEILSYGKGRCGEFSILFTSLCLAHGYRARLVLDMSDHVWSEVWDDKRQRWFHVDPSEKKMDDPLLYERDWKKNLTEVYAFENGKMENVTKSYKITKD